MSDKKSQVLIIGGGIAALEAMLALQDIASDKVSVTLIAPNAEFISRPMTVREPFAYERAKHFSIPKIASYAGATLKACSLEWIDREKKIAHTSDDNEIKYDALLIATGAKMCARYEHAITINDKDMDKTLHGLIQDIEGGYVKRIGFVSPGTMPWPLPFYEMALMTAGRAYDSDLEPEITIITPESKPLIIFGDVVSTTVSERLSATHINIMCSKYVEVPKRGEIVTHPGDRHFHVDSIVALPELTGPCVRGLPCVERGFLQTDLHGHVPHTDGVYAAGDATSFAVKHGGISSQQADVAAGVDIDPKIFLPVIYGMLLTDSKPLYISARITGGRGFASEVTSKPTWDPGIKVASKYLSPYLNSISENF